MMYVIVSVNLDVVWNRLFVLYLCLYSVELLDVEGGCGVCEKM